MSVRSSEDLQSRAAARLVGGVNSPVRSFAAVGGGSVLIERGSGAHVFDVDGRELIDLIGSWGAAIVGHAHPQVVQAVERAVRDGLGFGATHPSEIELAEIVCGAIPSLQRIRFVCSGTEACMSALRVARAATGRRLVLKFAGGYHGHGDAMLVAAGSGAATFGVPTSAGVDPSVAEGTLVARYNDLDDVDRMFAAHGEDIAAVIVEPIAGNMGMIEGDRDFLAGLRARCDQSGALLIFDEVMSGFRTQWGGIQNEIGVTPELTCLGKVIGGGLPVAAYGGRADLMDRVAPAGDVYQAGTLAGNPVAMSAGIATLKLCQQDRFYEELSTRAGQLCDGLSRAAEEYEVPLRTVYRGGMAGASFSQKPVRNDEDANAADREMFTQFFRSMLSEGVLLPPSPMEALFLSSAHDEAVVERIVHAGRKSLRASAQVKK